MRPYSGCMKFSGVKFYCPILGPTGYVYFGLGLAEELNKLTNMGLYAIDAPPGFDYRMVMGPQLLSSIHVADVLPRDTPAIILTMGGRSSFFRATGNPLIGYHMWESDKPPADYVSALTEMDEVWVPSKWGAECFKKAGVEKAIAMPGGVNPYVFNDMVPKAPELTSRQTFKFLCVGKWERRKGYDLLLKAWAQTFKPDEPVELVLSAYNPFLKDFNIWQKITQLHLGEMANLVVIDKPIQSYTEMATLYSSCDAFVMPTRGEGWNMPLIEAMSTGLPSIVTNWSGHTEYATKDNAYLLDYETVPAQNDPMWQRNFEGSNWAEPDFKQLCEYMRYVYDNKAEAKKKGVRAAKDVRSQWTWQHAAERIIKRLKAI